MLLRRPRNLQSNEKEQYLTLIDHREMESFYCHNRACNKALNGQNVPESGKVDKLYCQFDHPERRKSVTETASLFCLTTLLVVRQ